MYTHLKEYLRCVLTRHNLGDVHCRVNQETLNAPITAEARCWANTKFKNSFPTIMPPATPTAAADDAAILAPLLQAQMEAQAAFARGAATRGEEKKDSNTEMPPTLNMSPQEFNTTLLMCGLPPGSPPEALPEWLLDCSVKGQDAYKNTIIRCHIMNNFRYEDAEVQVTNSILKMASKQNCAGKESNINRPSFAHASEGLPLF